MCGRYVRTQKLDELSVLLTAAPAPELAAAPGVEGPRYNVCPTHMIPVARLSPEGARVLAPMRWGFVPAWYKTPTDGPLLINARSETIAEKPAFREACRSRRCLVPTSGFYEWREGAEPKEPWFIRLKGGAPMVMAGVWQDWTHPETGQSLQTCAVVTAEANEDIAHLHHRTPVILAPEHWGLWIGEEGKGAARLMKAPPPGSLEFWRVSPAVNSARAPNGPGLMAPLEGEGVSL